MCCVLGLALAVNQQQLVILVVRNHFIQAVESLFVLFAFLSKSIGFSFHQEANGNVVHLLLVKHSKGVGLVRALGRAVSDEKGTVLVDSL